MLLVIMALLPAVVLCVYVFKKDRVEKEPLGLLLTLLLWGALSCFPAAEIEMIMDDVINSVTRNSGINTHYFVKYFFGVALVEEAVKFAVLVFITRKNKAFNSLFDGLIYSVFVSLGFAALENVFYVLDYGFTTAVMRAFLSVPGHMFFAVMMGYHYSMWHIFDKAAQVERELKAAGRISQDAKEYSSKGSMVLCLVVPVIAHGLYDFCCMLDEWWATLALVAFVGFMYVHCFGKIKKMSKADQYEGDYVAALIFRKHGIHAGVCNEMNY